MNLRNRQSKAQIGTALKLGGTGLVGWGLASLLARPASADLWPPYHTGIYTYDGPDCAVGNEVDPVNVVFYLGWGHGSDAVDVVKALANEWAGFDSGGGGTQYFKDHYRCWVMDDQGGTEPGWLPVGRYHMRYHQGRQATGGDFPDFDPSLGYYVVADAHHEDYVPPPPIGSGNCGITGGHAVDGNLSEPPGGFDMARIYVEEKFDQAGFSAVENWNYGSWQNRLPRLQCDGEYAWSNYGDVVFIRIPEDIGPGCRGFCTQS